jgi:hypothetical protein
MYRTRRRSSVCKLKRDLNSLYSFLSPYRHSRIECNETSGIQGSTQSRWIPELASQLWNDEENNQPRVNYWRHTEAWEKRISGAKCLAINQAKKSPALPGFFLSKSR